MAIGVELQQARLARNLTLADVSAATKIQPWILESLEAEKLYDMMSPVYVKGFLINYSKFLRLAPEGLVAQLPWNKAPEVPKPVEIPKAPVVQARPVMAAAAKPPMPKVEAPKVEIPKITIPKVEVPKITLPKIEIPKISVPRIQMPKVELPKLTMPRIELPKVDVARMAEQVKELPWGLIRRGVAGVAAAAVVVGVIAINPLQHLPKIAFKSHKAQKLASVAPVSMPVAAQKPAADTAKKAAEPVKKAETAAKAVAHPAAAALAATQTQPAAKPAAQAAAQPVTPAPAAAAQAATSTKSVELALVAKRTTMVKLWVDGKLIVQQRIKRGAEEHWTAQKRFDIVVANPAQVDILVNGSSVSPVLIANDGRLSITPKQITRLADNM